MSLDPLTESTEEIQSLDQLVELHRASETPAEELRVGMEHEKIGLLEGSLQPVPYEGPRSISAIFQALVERFDFEPHYEGEKIIALKKDGTHVSLEPGGQLELSGAVLHNNHETCAELKAHRDLAHAVGDELGIAWLGIGHTPFATREEISWMPKGRYAIMRRYLPTRGERGLDMMLRTGTVQANFDYLDEADMAQKMRVAMAVSPLVSAIYANSPLVEGKATGWVSERQRIWTDVDPDRTGVLPFVFRDDFGYQDYVEWALDVPMFFIRRGGRYLDGVTGTPFRTFWERGFEGHRATLTDWQDHLTTLFPEVRLKGYIEVRSADCGSRLLNCAFPALWKGLLYDREAAEAAWALCRGIDPDTHRELIRDVAKIGLRAEAKGRPVLGLVQELVEISAEGLRRQGALDDKGRDERFYLDSVRAVLERGESPGETLVRSWEGELGRDPKALVEHLRF